MLVERLDLSGIVRFEPAKLVDERGYFSETFRQDIFSGHVGDIRFVQENQSFSARRGTVRGLHFQAPPAAQGKLVRCLAGSILDVVVDIRHGSPSFGRGLTVVLDADRGNQLWVPPGFAHGFCTLAPDTTVEYKVTAYYCPQHDKGLAWNDPTIGIEWSDVADPDTLSDKDRVQPKLAQLDRYFVHGAN